MQRYNFWPFEENMIKEGNNILMGNGGIGEIGGIRDKCSDYTVDEAGRIITHKPD